MPSDGKWEPVENFIDKIRSVFGPRDPQKRKDALPPKARFSIWYFLLTFLLFTCLQQYFLSSKVETILYSQFKQYMAEGTLSKLTIGPENINGTLRGEPAQKFTTVCVNDPGLVKDLDGYGVSYSGHYESKFLSTVLSGAKAGEIIMRGLLMTTDAMVAEKPEKDKPSAPTMPSEGMYQWLSQLTTGCLGTKYLIHLIDLSGLGS